MGFGKYPVHFRVSVGDSVYFVDTCLANQMFVSGMSDVNVRI